MHQSNICVIELQIDTDIVAPLSNGHLQIDLNLQMVNVTIYEIKRLFPGIRFIIERIMIFITARNNT